MKNDYIDIINIRYPFNSKRKRMSLANRASIFAPFSALSGYAEAINESGRITHEKIELDENRKEIINRKLNLFKNNAFKNEIKLKYFAKDIYKDGGDYIIIRCKIKKIDLLNKIIILSNKEKINIEDIVDVEYI